jgi:hypothetical protein
LAIFIPEGQHFSPASARCTQELDWTPKCIFAYRPTFYKWQQQRRKPEAL